MADAEEVCARLPQRDDVTYIGLVTESERGAERAIGDRTHQTSWARSSVPTDGIRYRQSRADQRRIGRSQRKSIVALAKAKMAD